MNNGDCREGGGEEGQPLGTGVYGQFSLAGNRVAELHLATRVFQAGNHISDEQWDKEQERARETRQQNHREIYRKKASREAEEAEEEKKSMKNTVKLRELERKPRHGFQESVFFLNAWLAASHIL